MLFFNLLLLNTNSFLKNVFHSLYLKEFCSYRTKYLKYFLLRKIPHRVPKIFPTGYFDNV